MINIKTFISSRFASIAFVIISIFSRVVNVLFLSYAGRDKMFVVLQSKNFLDGKGFAIPEYFTSNPEVPVYDYTPMWPPGYPFLLAPFLKMFNYDVYWATTALDIIACIALIFVIRKLCWQIGFPTIAVNLMTLVAGCFEYMFINDSKPTDNVPIVLFLFGISLVIKLVSDQRFSLSTILFAAFILFLPNVFRYSYPPLSIAVPVSVLFIGFVKKESLLKKKGTWLFAFVLVMVATFLFTMKLTTGYAGYAVPTARGYFPENLIHWYPVLPASFINVAFLASQTRIIAAMSLETTLRILEIINIITVSSLVLLFVYLFFNKNFLATLTPFKWFLVTGFFTTAATFVSLGYLSFTYDVQRWKDFIWSYVYDHRYYAFVFIFLQVAFLGWIFLYKSSLKNILLKLVAACFSLVLFVEITHNIYFHTKVAFNFKKYKSAVFREQDYVYFFKLMKELEEKYPDHDIWSTSSGDFFYQYTATYMGHRGISDVASFKDKTIKVNKKTILTVMLYDHEVSEYSDFLSRSKVLFTKKIDNSNNYIIELLP